MVTSIYSQTNISQIEKTYHKMDSVIYLKSIKNAVIQSVISDFKEPLYKHILERCNFIVNGIGNNTVKFALNIDIDTNKFDTYDYLEIDTSFYNFNIYCVDRQLNPVYFIFFRNNRLDFFGDFYPTFSRSYSEKIKHALSTVLKKEPEFLLNCYSLPNTILYVKKGKIYVYEVIRKKKYLLEDYIDRFQR